MGGMAGDGGTRAVITALAANLGIAVTKFVAWALTGASSMLAEAIHSVADSCNQALLLIGGRRAQQAATPEHPFGHGKLRYVYGFLVAIVLFSVGGLFALYEAYHKWNHPEPIEGRWWWLPLAVVAVAMVFEGFALRTAVIESNKVRGRARWGTFVRKAKQPELPVILLEDTAALIGLAFAGLGVGLTLLTGDGMWDALGTAMIGLLLVGVAVVLGVEMKSLLVGEAATEEHVAAIRSALEGGADSQVTDVIHLRTLHVGPEEILVTAKLAIEGSDTGDEVVREINAAERRAREAMPAHELILYLEPDIARTGGLPPEWDPQADTTIR
jgi:cation diffusion facilitator family transporter